MRLNFCTLFNSGYLSRGLAMYHSLSKVCNDFHLFVYAFDDICYKFLEKENYPNLTPISLQEFEDDELLKIKPFRTATEYCWTCSSSAILYTIQHFNLESCTYIDADLFFYADPAILIEEMGSNSVLITPHRYTTEYDQSATSGIYCVQFVTFKNDKRGIKVLEWWRNACLEWCYNRMEDGKFGDQKYLDDWTIRFKGVHELEHLGGGVAPWNVQQYSFKMKGKDIFGREIIKGEKFHVIFYHFHALRFYNKGIIQLTGNEYRISKSVRYLFYRPYLNELKGIGDYIREIAPNIDPHGVNEDVRFMPQSVAGRLKRYAGELYHDPTKILKFNLHNIFDYYHVYHEDQW